MKRKCITLSLAVFFVAASSLCPAYAQQGAKPPMKAVKIGVISPLSGPLTFIGTSMLRGVQMAVKDVNEKGTREQRTGAPCRRPALQAGDRQL